MILTIVVRCCYYTFLRVLSVHSGCVCWIGILSLKWCQGRSLCYRSVMVSGHMKLFF